MTGWQTPWNHVMTICNLPGQLPQKVNAFLAYFSGWGGFTIPEWRDTHSCPALNLCQACARPPSLPWGSLHFLLYCNVSPLRSWKTYQNPQGFSAPDWIDTCTWFPQTPETPHTFCLTTLRLCSGVKNPPWENLGRIFSPWMERYLCTTCAPLLQSLVHLALLTWDSICLMIHELMIAPGNEAVMWYHQHNLAHITFIFIW